MPTDPQNSTGMVHSAAFHQWVAVAKMPNRDCCKRAGRLLDCQASQPKCMPSQVEPLAAAAGAFRRPPACTTTQISSEASQDPAGEPDPAARHQRQKPQRRTVGGCVRHGGCQHEAAEDEEHADRAIRGPQQHQGRLGDAQGRRGGALRRVAAEHRRLERQGEVAEHHRKRRHAAQAVQVRVAPAPGGGCHRKRSATILPGSATSPMFISAWLVCSRLPSGPMVSL